MDKKVLIITYYWPPAGGPGVQRWLKFTKYLPDFGIEPTVYIPTNPAYPITDDNLMSDISSSTKIIGHKIIEPYNLASFFSGSKVRKISSGIIPSERTQSTFEKLMLWIRGNLFIPDARILWVAPSVRYLQKYIKKNEIDTIITTGPPHSLHLIGLRLKKKINVRWIADFRDPWTTIGYHESLKLSNYAREKHQTLEQKVLNAADEIIVTSKTTKADFERLTSKPITVITNGFDIENVEPKALDADFTLAHIGSLLSDRNPIFLWQALSELIDEVADFKNHFKLKLIGNVSRNVLESLHTYNLDNYVENLGYVSHNRAISEQRSSQVLLVVEINSAFTKSIIPGKLFEYMASGRPIIGIGPNGSDMTEIITSSNTGVFVDYSQIIKLKEAIISNFEKYKLGQLRSNGVGIDQYSRKSLTKKLVTLLNK